MLCVFFAITRYIVGIFYLKAEGPCSECVMNIFLRNQTEMQSGARDYCRLQVVDCVV